MTTEPFTVFNSSISPRAIMIGAKKLTRKTWFQVSRSVSTLPSLLPFAAFGEIAALLTSACSWPPSRRFADLVDRAQRIGGIGEVDLDVILRPRVPRALLGKRHAASR